jgi:ABC-type multidrug transport system fused ATPase/permease subunit
MTASHARAPLARRHSPRAMRLIADQLALGRALRSAGPGVVASLALVLVIGASVPAGVAVALGSLVGRIGHSGNDVLRGMLVSLLAFAAIVLIGHVADVLAKLLELQARIRIDGAHRSRLIRLATSIDGISHLEDPQVQRLIRQAGAEPDFGMPGPADGALAQLRWATGLTGAAVICVILAEFAWWAVPLVLVPALISLHIRARQYFAQAESLRAAMKEELHADVWRDAASSSAEGKDVRVFGFGEWMIDRMQRHIYLGNTPFWEQVARVARQAWAQLALILCGLAPLYVVVSRSAAAGHATVSEQTAVLIVGWAVFLSVGTGQGIYEMAGSAAALRAFGELRTLLRPLRGGGGHATARFTDAAVPPLVRFEQVKFSYPGTGREILSGVDLEIAPGEMLAIVGLNGAGKSTLMKLLSGLYAPDCGRITADGRSIAEYGLPEWRRKITVVFQDFVRYQLSLLDNVVLGRADVPPDAGTARAAAAEAGLSAVVGRLPAGWDTLLARNRTGGVDLSGGQWQQVVLARALYAVAKGTRLLVLDEPTAHVDVRTEFEIFKRLAGQRGDTSVVLISHRLSTVRLADRIVLLADGKVAEAGTHDELMAANGAYAGLFRIQAERFRQDREPQEGR